MTSSEAFDGVRSDTGSIVASRLKPGLRESRAAVARQVLVVPALFCVANCCCRRRNARLPI